MVMGSGNGAISSSQNTDLLIAGICERHKQELENLTFTTQPFKTLKFFVLAMIQYFKQSVIYLLAKGSLMMLLSSVIAAIGLLVVTIDGPHEKYLEELSHCLRFGLWWTALGVASSIGFGSGLHTFVLYLGPHLNRGPSWLDKDCHEFGEPVFPSSPGPQVPLSSILPQVQLEAIIWGVGTALGELPPYFISRAAFISGNKLDAVEELDASAVEDNGFIAAHLKSIKCRFLSHAQHLNFFTILVLASVPNPLFDFAGIMCGQFGIPFWKFFLSTLIGKAIIKTHIQTVFIISICNNQLLNWVENELISVLGLVPGLAPALPDLTTKLHTLRENYMAPTPSMPSNQVKKGNFSFAAIWNTVVWLMLLKFFLTIVTSNAQRYLKKQQDEQLAALTKCRSPSRYSG